MKLPDFKLERYFAQYEFNSPHLLCCSDCETVTIQDILKLEDGAIEAFMNLPLGYTEAPGSMELRKQITGLYNHMAAENILVCSGAEEAIFLFMNAVLEPGDHVIVQYPCYQSLIDIACAIGCEVSKWEMAEENNWELDLEYIERNIQSNTKAVIMNLPHNPTGYMMTNEKWHRLLDLLRENNILLLSDEVYRFLEYDEKDRLEAACDIYPNAVSIGVMSKTYGLAGLRIGWIATANHKIMNKISSLKDYTTICNSAPSEFLAAIALKHCDVLRQRNLKIINRNLFILDDFFNRNVQLFNWVKPKAGPIAFPSIKWKDDVDQFCSDLLTNSGILLLPSSCYDFGQKNFRIGFGRENLPLGIRKLDDYLRRKFD